MNKKYCPAGTNFAVITIIILLGIFATYGCGNRPSSTGSIEGSFFNIDTTSRGTDIPLYNATQTWSGKGWRGERISSQLLIWAPEFQKEIKLSSSALSGKENALIPETHINLYEIKFVMTDVFAEGCEKTGVENYDSSLVADLLKPLKSSIQIGVQVPLLIWISIDIPSDADPGFYSGEIQVREGNSKGLKFTLELEVLSPELPPSSEWGFHLDLWQNPFSVARLFNVEPWSELHFERMKPTMKMLADAGQKCITTTISDKPWGGQTFDPFKSMVKKTKTVDGTWTYDYSIFDAWVEFAMECGIDQQINCFSMVTWNNQYTYFDESREQELTVSCNPGSREYNELWIPFLNNFNDHLLQKNWQDLTAISMDERSMEDLMKVIELVDREAPELRIAFAGRYHPELDHVLFDLSVASMHIVPDENLAKRAAEKFKTTFYVCCVEEQPNTFSFSNSAEASYLAWYAANRKFDGMLRWSYNSWTESPLQDTRFRRFPGGDTYIVYPGGQSSVRFERLREGIQDFEKIRILKKELMLEGSAGSHEKLKLLYSQLAKFDIQGLSTIPASETLAEGKELLHLLSR